jgi:AAA+ ATPase superfamily predicted ATPase
LHTIDSRHSGGKFEFAVIYGRRRVGKTAPIGGFAEGKRAVMFQAREQSHGENLDVLKVATGDV